MIAGTHSLISRGSFPLQTHHSHACEAAASGRAPDLPMKMRSDTQSPYLNVCPWRDLMSVTVTVQCSLLCNQPLQHLDNEMTYYHLSLVFGATCLNAFHLCLMQFGQVWQRLHSPARVTRAAKLKGTHSFTWKMTLQLGENLQVKYLHGILEFQSMALGFWDRMTQD